MTNTEIHEALEAVGQAVAVPPVDRVAFQARVRVVRRRRAATRVVLAGAAAAVLAGGVVLAHGGTDDTVEDRPPVADQGEDANGVPTPVRRVVVLEEGRIQVLMPDGASYDKGVQAEGLLGTGAAGAVYLDRDSRLMLLPVRASGEPGTPRPLAHGQEVREARLAADGTTYGWVDLQGTLHLGRVGSEVDHVQVQVASGRTRLLAVADDSFVTDDDGTLRLRDGSGAQRVTTGFPATGADLGGSTLAVQTGDGVELFEAATGAHRFGSLGDLQGALSPDGTHYVTAPDQEQRDQATPNRIELIDTDRGLLSEIEGVPADAAVLDLTWQDDDRFLVLGAVPQRTGNRVLWDCSVAAGSCTERLDDPSGTLQIAAR